MGSITLVGQKEIGQIMLFRRVVGGGGGGILVTGNGVYYFGQKNVVSTHIFYSHITVCTALQ